MPPSESPLTRREALLLLGGFFAACENLGTNDELSDAATSADTPSPGGDASDGPAGDVAAPSDTAASADTVTATPSVPEDTPAIPAITPNRHHYITSCCGSPEVNGATWALELRNFVGCGDCEAPVEILATLTLAFLEGLEAQDREHTLECIGTGPGGQKISNAVWSGRTLLDVFAAAGVTVPGGATELRITSVDGFSTGLPLTDLDAPLWLVWRMDGEPLPARHGYPARLLVPGRYGMKNPKWIKSIDFLDAHHVGYWESRGWSDPAEYRVHTYIRYPAHKASVAAGTVRVNGVAFAGSDPVTSVEVSVDGGSWTPATLDYAPGADRWVIWHADWPAAAGDHTVQARCTTASGATSAPESRVPTDLGGYGGSHEITLTVT